MSKESARHFLENETAFHLGAMLTEQSHPKTRGLSTQLEKSPTEGLKMLLNVDDDIPPVARKTFSSQEYEKLKNALYETLESGNRVFFTGCGATGRLAILLDAAHRRFCDKMVSFFPEHAEFFTKIKEQTLSVMTGGDFALIRSVESFEDFIAFGKRQMYDAGITSKDCLVAISEGGETSSVIGTIHAALEVGAKANFLFNNPKALLIEKVERSRIVLEDSRVNTIELATGPMAIAGSTRMQATSIEMLIAGAAWEFALWKFLEKTFSSEILKEKFFPKLGYEPISEQKMVDLFETQLSELRMPENLQTLADWIVFEKELYAERGLVTYFPDAYSLDIFTDTTERSPTFKTPPYCSTLEDAPQSWAFVKDPVRSNAQAWLHIYGRKPICIEWTTEDYHQMGAPDKIADNPPHIGASILSTYLIGNEPMPARTDKKPNAAVAFLIGNEKQHLAGDDWWNAFLQATSDYEKRAVLLIAPEKLPGTKIEAYLEKVNGPVFSVAVSIPGTPLELFAHLGMKVALNNVSTATMGLIGRLSGNWMNHVDATNKKLIDRTIRLVSELAGVDYSTACYAVFESLEEMESWPIERRKTISPAAYTIERLGK